MSPCFSSPSHCLAAYLLRREGEGTYCNPQVSHGHSFDVTRSGYGGASLKSTLW